MKLQKTLVILSIAALATATTGCDDGGRTAPATTPDGVADNGATGDASGADAAGAPDTPPEDTKTGDPDAAVEPEVPAGPPPYPEGPYGYGTNDVIANLSFFHKLTGETVQLSDFYQHNFRRMVMIVSTAAWCGVCKNDGKKLIPIYEQYEPAGLEILFALSRDKNDQPMYGPTANIAIHDLIMDDYLAEVGMPYPLVADQGYELEPYYPQPGLPLVILLDTATMQIVYVATGFNEAYITSVVHQALWF